MRMNTVTISNEFGDDVAVELYGKKPNGLTDEQWAYALKFPITIEADVGVFLIRAVSHDGIDFEDITEFGNHSDAMFFWGYVEGVKSTR